MWRTTSAAVFLSISLVSNGMARGPDWLSCGLMVSPSDQIPRAPIGHRQPIPSNLVPTQTFDGTLGASLRKSRVDPKIDREIFDENKVVDRKISGICRGC
jgi:hypothetical protein